MSAIKKRKLNGGKASVLESPTQIEKKASISSPPPNGLESVQKSPASTESEDEAEIGPEEESEKSEEADGSESATVEAQGTPMPAAPQTFQELGIIDSLCEACETLGYTKPTPIQTEAIPPALQGRDIIGLAETGSGKTAAFALPMLQALMKNPQPFFGLILAPTRELADQIKKAYQALGSVINVQVALLVGGLDMMPQSIALAKKPHIIVATPGRLLDHLENTKGFSLRKLKALVLDEADRMLDLDFQAILDKILRVLPRDTRRTSLFSATISGKVESLQRASLRNPLKVSVSAPTNTVATLKQSFIFFPQKDKDSYLVHVANANHGRSTIIFTRTVNETQRIAYLLRALGFQAIPLHGQLSQNSRLGALNKFRSQGRNILVATDVAARGLDIQGVDVVINFDLPGDSKTYIHRVGRTARAGRSGKAISLVTQYDVELWQRIEHALGKKLPDEKIDREEIMVLGERVNDAQRVAIKQMKDAHENRGKKGSLLRGRRDGPRGAGGKRGRDDMDREER